MTKPFQKGDRVTVSDGTPEPPVRFKRKHASWQFHNFTGYVWRHDSFGVAVDKSNQGVFCVVVPAHMVRKA